MKIMYKYKTVWLTIFVIENYFIATSDSCTTPSGQEGECKIILECIPLFFLMTRKSSDDLNLLRRSNCGFTGEVPHVCCPLDPTTTTTTTTATTTTTTTITTTTEEPSVSTGECYTPNGEQGHCINITECDAIVSMIMKPGGVTAEDRQYIENSSCKGPAAFNVCCLPRLQPRPIGRLGGCTATALPPSPESECCGLYEDADRIIGGDAAGLIQFTWLVRIDYLDNSSLTACGGSLISGRWVLTAAHCVAVRHSRRRRAVSVRLGEYDTSNSIADQDCVAPDDCTDGAISVPIETIIQHPLYQPEPLHENDIALVRLSRIVQFTDFIKPICLPPSSGLTLSNLTVAGWGATREMPAGSPIKRFVNIPYVPKHDCIQKYQRLNLTDGQMCAGGVPDMDACAGDSGGPLMHYASDRNHRFYAIVGIVSFGPKRCGINYPGVYTNVTDYLDWIWSTMRSYENK